MNPALFVHVPAHLLPTRLDFLLKRKLQPEVACQEIDIDQLDISKLEDCAATLAADGLGTTFHAPFNKFNPGSNRKRVRQHAMKLAKQSLSLARSLKAKILVFHPGIPYGCSTNQVDLWVKENIQFWPEFVEEAKSFECFLCLENIYESVPDPLLQVCGEINSPYFGHCFDIGHWNIFGTRNLLDWLDQATPWLKHFHLHDNFGAQDEHLPIGKGQANFSLLFNWLRENNSITYTLEAHRLSDLEISLTEIGRHFPI